jgi:hypothetical protein
MSELRQTDAIGALDPQDRRVARVAHLQLQAMLRDGHGGGGTGANARTTMIAAIVSGSEWHHGGWTGEIPYADETSVSDVDTKLAAAERYVAEARRIVAWQHVHMLKLKVAGQATQDHELTLQAFVSTLAILESHAGDLSKSAKRLERPRRLLS